MTDTNDIAYIEYQKLHLDTDNPRLPSTVTRTPKSILTWIAKATAIEDLMNAIGTNNFFAGEPLVVYQHPKKSGEYIVIEGNRRLTAVKLLHDPYECDKPSSQMLALSQESKYKPEKIPVVIQDNRDDVLPYLGFRHITGIEEWQPLAKARYLKQLFDLSIKKEVSERYSDVARTIGSRKDAIKRSLDALAVYNLIEEHGFFEIPELSEETVKFSVLSTALADERIAEFVGSTKKIPVPQSSLFDSQTIEFETVSTDPIVNINVLNKSSVEDLTHWLFEKKDGKTIVGDSRNLGMLGKVIATPRALAALKSNSTLAYAFRLTTGVNDEFINRLYSAQAALEQAAGLVANVDYDSDAMVLTREIFNSIKQIGKSLTDKNLNKEDDF